MANQELLRNAWLVKPDSFSYFLRYVYENAWGEVWLYNNDLAVFKDTYLFGELYVSLIGRVLREKIDAVKILLPGPLYDEFVDCGRPSYIHENLKRLAAIPGRLSVIHVGSLERASPQIGYATDMDDDDHDVWVFYTAHGQLSSGAGMVMLRHNVYPFAATGGERVCLCWMLKDEDVLKQRLMTEKFEQVFKNDSNFVHPVVVEENPFRLEFRAGLSEETKRRRAQRFGEADDPIVREDEIDVAVLAALPEELKAVADRVAIKRPLRGMPGAYYGEIHEESEDTCRLVMMHFGRMGNSYAAVATLQVLNRWSPRALILVGIAGGNRNVEHLRLGDVLVATSIHAYEYQKIEPVCPDGRRVPKREPRMYSCSLNLVRCAGHVQVCMNERAESAELSDDQRMEQGIPRVFIDVLASGSKLIADDEFIQQELVNQDRKIIGMEMEGEGVMVAAEAHFPRPDVLVVKGVSDYADPASRIGPNRDVYRKRACDAAGEFVIECLRKGAVRRPRV